VLAATSWLLAWLACAEPTSTSRAEGPRPLEPLPQREHDEVRAREAWNRGAQAFGEGRLEDAIREFEETFRHSGRPGPLFSLGQAHRHRWEKTGDPRQRALAILRYQQYLQLDPDGRRRLEAERLIRELQTIDELEDDADEPRIFTRIGLASRTPGAIATIDGGPPVALPITPDVAPGRHEVVVSAPGFHAQRRALHVPEGSTVPLAVDLVPLGARLVVRGPAGADLYVDGGRVGALPRAGRLTLSAGVHQVGVAQRGRTLFVREVALGRGEQREVRAQLELTGQRKIAYAMFGIGAAAAAGSIVLGALAFDAQRHAQDIEDERTSGSIDDDAFQDRQQWIARRDSLRTASLATGISGLAVLAAGVVLYFTDRPPVASQLRRPDVRAQRLQLRPSLDASVHSATGGMRGRF
jgi:hypothetical protein